MLYSATNFIRFSRKIDIFVEKFLWIFKVLFTKSTLKQGLERQFQHIMTKNKKHGIAVLFCVRYQLGLPPPNPDQRTFCKKSFGISKTFAKVKWCFRWEILLPTFLIRKVGRCEVLWHTFLRKKGVGQIIDATFLLYSVGDMPYLLWKRLLK